MIKIISKSEYENLTQELKAYKDSNKRFNDIVEETDALIKTQSETIGNLSDQLYLTKKENTTLKSKITKLENKINKLEEQNKTKEIVKETLKQVRRGRPRKENK